MRAESKSTDVLRGTLAFLTLLPAFEAAQHPLRPIYGTVATLQHHWALFLIAYAISFFCLSSRRLWSAQAGCCAAAYVLVAHPWTLSPGFKASSHLGTAFGPLVAQLTLGVPLVVAVVGSLNASSGKVGLVAFLVAGLYGTIAMKLPNLTLSFSAWGYELYLFAVIFMILSLPLPSPAPTSAPPRKNKKMQRYQKPSTSSRPNFVYLVVRIALFCLFFAASYLYSRPRITSALPWSHLRRGPQVLASSQSVTGKVAVIEYELAAGQWLRALKADHSLLGGIWIGPARTEQLRRAHKPPELANESDEAQAVEIAQSIFNTFYLQEAVRLLKRDKQDQERALIIGLGTGISATALSKHGVNVSIAELDPAVYAYARDFFGVPPPQAGLYLESARKTIQRPGLQPFDYIIHDVFTGGSVPSSLFTLEFWQDIKKILKPDGVLAVNFAGELNSTASQAILHTLTQSFSSSRAFDDGTQSAFRNFVVFCTDSPQLEFRSSTSADALDVVARQEVFDHFLEREINPKQSQGLTLTDANSSVMDTWQHASALQHWQTLRDQIGADFWMA